MTLKQLRFEILEVNEQDHTTIISFIGPDKKVLLQLLVDWRIISEATKTDILRQDVL